MVCVPPLYASLLSILTVESVDSSCNHSQTLCCIIMKNWLLGLGGRSDGKVLAAQTQRTEFGSSASVLKAGSAMGGCHPACEGRDRQIPGSLMVCQLSQSVSSRFNEQLSLKKQTNQNRMESNWSRRCRSASGWHTNVHMHTQANVRTGS